MFRVASGSRSCKCRWGCFSILVIILPILFIADTGAIAQQLKVPDCNHADGIECGQSARRTDWQKVIACILQLGFCDSQSVSPRRGDRPMQAGELEAAREEIQ